MEVMGSSGEDRRLIAKPSCRPTVFIHATGFGEECFPKVGVENV